MDFLAISVKERIVRTKTLIPSEYSRAINGIVQIYGNAAGLLYVTVHEKSKAKEMLTQGICKGPTVCTC